MEKLLLRPNEAAELLGVGRSTIYALLASGDVPSVRVGRSVRLPLEALKQWVAARAAGKLPDTEAPREGGL